MMFKRYIIILIALSVTLAGCNTLTRAAANGDIAALRKQIQKGVNINTIDNKGWTPLFWAAYYDNAPAVKFLLDSGAKVDFQSSKEYGYFKKGTTALMIAAMYGYYKTADILIAKKANIFLQNADGDTALTIAKMYNFQNIIDLLDPNNRDARRAQREEERKMEAIAQNAINIELNDGISIVGFIKLFEKDYVVITDLKGNDKRILKNKIMFLLRK